MKQEKSLKEIMEQLTYYTHDWSFSRILKESQNGNFETLLTSFVYHEYQKLKSTAKFRKWRNVSNRDLTSWLENITDQNRFQYFDCIQKVDANLTKIESWLEFIEETPNSLYNLGKNLKVSNQKLDFLYYLLADIEEDILFKHHRKIEDLIFTMGKELKQEKLKILEKQEILQSTKTELKNIQLNFYHSEKVSQKKVQI